MKSKCLIVVAVDTSGSMLQEHGATKFSKIQIINYLLPNFLAKIRMNPILTEKVEVAIVEIKENARVVVPPSDINKVEIPIFDTIPETEESIGLGISLSLDVVKKWKRSNYFSELLKQNYTSYLVLITDLSQEYLIDEERQHPFRNKVERFANNNHIKFFGIGVGSAQLVSFFNSNIANIHVTNNPNFEMFLLDIEKELSKELKQDKPLKEEITLIYKYYKFLAPLFKKHLKKIVVFLIVILLSPISFSGMKARGIKIEIEKLIEINNTEIKNYEANYPENNININIEKETDWIGGDTDVKFKYEFKDVIDDYNLGAYLHNSSDKVWRSNRILLLNLLDLQRKFDVNGEIYIKVTGETDAYEVQDLTYKGEFGQLSDKVFYESGRWYKMSLKKDDKIKNNHELAFLRGYSTWDLVRRNFELVISRPTQFQQVVRVNDNTNRYGGRYRRVIIEMILYDVEERAPSVIQRFLD